MNKWDALKLYAGQMARPKYVKHNICEEVCDAMSDWKADKFAPSTTKLDSLSDSDFMTEYEAEFKDTFQHEMAEAVEHAITFTEAHGLDLMLYYNALKRYRSIKTGSALPNRIILVR